MPLAQPKFSPHPNGEFSLYRKLYATEIKVDYSSPIGGELKISLQTTTAANGGLVVFSKVM